MSSNLIRTKIWTKKVIFVWVMLSPYIKSRGTEDTKMSANADLIIVETYAPQGKTIQKQFLIYGLKCKTNVYCWLFEGPWGHSIIWLSILLSGYPLILTVQITFIFIGQTRLVFGKCVCTCVTKHSNAFRTFLNWLKNSKRVWHEPKLHISRLPLFANFDLWAFGGFSFIKN